MFKHTKIIKHLVHNLHLQHTTCISNFAKVLKLITNIVLSRTEKKVTFRLKQERYLQHPAKFCRCKVSVVHFSVAGVKKKRKEKKMLCRILLDFNDV